MSTKRLQFDSDSDAYVLAISCHQKSIKLAWEINRALNCELVAQSEIEDNIYFIEELKGQAYFKWQDPSQRFTLHLVSNRGEDNLLVPTHKQIDYFFIVTGFYKELDFETGTEKIKKIESVLTAFPVALHKVKK